MSENELLSFHLKKCVGNDRQSQKYIFQNYYSFVESFCEPYTGNNEELSSLVNQCFLLIFKNLPFDVDKKILTEVLFFDWLRKWMVCGIVSYNRNNFKHRQLLHFVHIPVEKQVVSMKEYFGKFYAGKRKKTTEQIDRVIYTLPASGQVILNLLALENFTCAELATCLEISTATAAGIMSRLSGAD